MNPESPAKDLSLVYTIRTKSFGDFVPVLSDLIPVLIDLLQIV